MRILVFLVGVWSGMAVAQAPGEPLTIATVTREPFSLMIDGEHSGFSIDLMNAAAAEIGLNVQYERFDSCTVNILSVILTRDVGILVVSAVLLLLAGGMLMYVFERKHQPYFDHKPKDAVFPAFWWALNLVVNGGFEERMPQSRPGRAFGVMLVIGSLFIVSIFVAQITAALTVNAIQENVDSVADLEGRGVGTIAGSTTADFLNKRDIAHFTYADLDVFTTGDRHRETVDQAFLRLREDGTYDSLITKWFGASYGR